MRVNVSRAINSRTGQILTVTRTASGGYVDGLYIKGTESSFPLTISVQSPTPMEVQMLEIGERKKDIKKFVCATELLMDDDLNNQLADHVEYRGNDYKIIQASDYQSYGYTRAFGARVE